MSLERRSGFFVVMGREVVENDCRAWRDLRDQDLLHIGREGRTIHRAIDHPRCDQSLMCQPRNQGLGSPTAERRIHRQALASFCSSTQAGQIGLHCGFINEDNAIRQGRNGRKPMFEPVSPLLPYLGATALGGNQRLFLYVNPSRDSRLEMEE